MKVVWTASANRRYEYIMTCAVDFYGKGTLRKLNSAIRNAEQLLVDNPRMGNREPLAKDREAEYRCIVLSKYFKLIYILCSDCIYVVDIWDTRQAPETLQDRL